VRSLEETERRNEQILSEQKELRQERDDQAELCRQLEECSKVHILFLFFVFV
jgi:hypothetical protein